MLVTHVTFLEEGLLKKKLEYMKGEETIDFLEKIYLNIA